MTSSTKCTSEVTSPSSRGQDLMLGSRREERSAIRALLTTPVTVVSDGKSHLGLLRDLSLTGVFFYTEFEPAYGAAMELYIKLTAEGSKILVCRGSVVRVAHGSAGSACGVAVRVAEFRLSSTSGFEG